MKFTKQELLFLEMYAACSDTRNILHDKLIIKTDIENKKVIFAQISYDASLYTEIAKNDIDKDFTVIYDVNTFCSIIRLTPETEEIFIDGEKIKFGKNSTYDFKKYNLDSSIINKLAVKNTTNNEVIIKDLSKVNLLKSFIGVDSFAMISIFNNYFVASNSTDITGAVSTENKNVNFILPKTLLQLISLLKLNELKFEKINLDNSFFNKIIVNNTNIYLPERESKIENIFEKNIRDLYYHNTKSIVKKSDLLLALQRISITTSQNIYNRVCLIFEIDKIHIVNNEVGHAEEIISAQSDKVLNGVKISLSASYLKMMASLIDGENVVLLISPDSDAVAITLEGDTKDRFFVHNLYETIDTN